MVSGIENVLTALAVPIISLFLSVITINPYQKIHICSDINNVMNRVFNS